MTDQPDVRQVLVHPAVWPHLELWLASRNLLLARVPVEDDLPTYAMVLAAPGDAEKVIRDAARQAAGQPATEPLRRCSCGIEEPHTFCPPPWAADGRHGPTPEEAAARQPDRAAVQQALKDTRTRALIDAAEAVTAAADAEEDYYAPQGMYQAADLLRRMADEAAR